MKICANKIFFITENVYLITPEWREFHAGGSTFDSHRGSDGKWSLKFYIILNGRLSDF